MKNPIGPILGLQNCFLYSLSSVPQCLSLFLNISLRIQWEIQVFYGIQENLTHLQKNHWFPPQKKYLSFVLQTEQKRREKNKMMVKIQFWKNQRWEDED